MRAQLLAGVRAVLVLTVLCGLIYPLAVLGVSQLVFPDKANGSLVKQDGVVVGSSLLGQEFTSENYFQGRPSAAGAAASGSKIDGEPADPTDLTVVASGASNLGPTNQDLLDVVAEQVAAYRELNGLSEDILVPVDAVTSSGSGLDPHISIANARLQAPRVADARGMDVADVLAMVDAHTSGRSLGFLGEKGVNVLELNLALDARG